MSTTTESRLGNLPNEITSFVGRRVEVSETKRLLSLSRLTTLTGEGGVGKSRIAQQVAGQVARAFDDGVWLVELSGHREKSAIVLAVADIFGLVLAADTAEAELIDHLFDRRVLLVFDCCEASVVAISELCVVLLKRCPHLRILTTSRQTLGIVGEGVLAILPLPTPREDHGTVLRGL
ncbi:NB-ARC domain-containing protein, partial [Streptomyces sp. NPDC017890]|uniref:NB-ARC domain-containing protein n=1 Tax=Streptomyces sp. NPDC017890 TaxID=3365015 RepID=UPI00379671D7